MIRSSFVTIGCSLIFILSSCGENEAGGINAATGSTATPQLPSLPTAAPGSPVVSTGAPIIPGGRLNPAHGQPGHRCDIAVGAPLPAGVTPALQINPVSGTAPQNGLPAATATTAAPAVANGLNPAHGQPGHRCDIPVGQPLNTPVAKKPAATTALTPTNTEPDTMFAKGLNPAHGKPGHRCDIAVGQPLNTPAKKDTAVSSGSN